MAQYIDKSAVIAEINNRIDICNIKKHSCPVNTQVEAICDNKIHAYKELLSFIDTLEVKEVNLDNFIKEEFNKYSCVDGYGQLSVSYNMAEFYGMIKRLTKAQKGEKMYE